MVIGTLALLSSLFMIAFEVIGALAPKRDEVLYNTGGIFTYLRLSVHPKISPARASPCRIFCRVSQNEAAMPSYFFSIFLLGKTASSLFLFGLKSKIRWLGHRNVPGSFSFSMCDQIF